MNMDALILGGNSPSHKAWIRRAAEVLEPQFTSVKYLDYRHWERGGNANVKYEMAQAAKLSGELESGYIVVAKSVGTVIATLAVSEGKLNPARCVLIGFPLPMLKELPAIAPALDDLPPSVFVQHTHDPLGPAADVREFVAQHGNGQATVVETPGSTHNYIDFKLIAELAAGKAE